MSRRRRARRLEARTPDTGKWVGPPRLCMPQVRKKALWSFLIHCVPEDRATIDKQRIAPFTSNHSACTLACTGKFTKVANKALKTKVYKEFISSLDEFVLDTLFSLTPVASLSLSRGGSSVVLLDVVSRSSCRICSLKIKYKANVCTEQGIEHGRNQEKQSKPTSIHAFHLLI